MKITGLDHYNIRVPMALLEPLRRFYVEVLNLRVGQRPPFHSSGYWLYAGERPLVHLSGFAPAAAMREQIRPTGWFDHVAFACENPAVTMQRLRELDIEYVMDTVPETGQIQLFFNDPAGIGVELNFASNGTANENQ